MARPKKGTEIGASAGVAFRITPELRQNLDSLAREHGHSLTDEIRAALERHVARAAKGKPAPGIVAKIPPSPARTRKAARAKA